MADLQSIPSFAELLNNPTWRPLSQRQDSTNKLVDILWSDQAFRAWQALYRARRPDDGSGTGNSSEYRLLLSLGPHVAGWQNIAHGGMLMMILDEAMQELAQVELQAHTFTRELTATFERPLRLPGVVVARAWAEDPVAANMQGSRKIWIICQVEDAAGAVYVKGRALFIKVRSSRM